MSIQWLLALSAYLTRSTADAHNRRINHLTALPGLTSRASLCALLLAYLGRSGSAKGSSRQTEKREKGSRP